MVFQAILSKLLLEIFMVIISAFALAKAFSSRNISRVSGSYNYFVAANLLFTVMLFLSGLHREGICLTGVIEGYVIYGIMLYSLGNVAYAWFNFVEMAVGSDWVSSNKKKLLAAIPMFTFAALTLVSCWTGWVFTIDSNGVYSQGSLGFLQYLFCFGYVIWAMIRSCINFFKSDKKHDRELVLFIAMIVDLAIMVAQIFVNENLVPIASTFNVILGYAEIYSIDIQEIKDRESAESSARMQKQLERYDMIHEIIHSGKWSFKVSADDRITDAYYSEEAMRIINNDYSSGKSDWTEVLHPDDKEKTLADFMATVKDHTCRTPYDVTYRMADRNGEYHWFHSAGRMVRNEDGTGEFFGVHINIDDQMNEQERRIKETEETGKLLESMSASFNMAYFVNIGDDSFRELRKDKFMIGHDKKFDNFTQAKEFFFQLLSDYDRELMRYELDYETIRTKLSKTDSYTVEYRVPINGAMMWHEMKVSSIDSDEVAIGFAMKDIEITQRHLEDIRFKEYFALYEVDIDTETIKVVKDSPYYGIGRYGASLPYKFGMTSFAATLDGEAKTFFARLADIEYVKRGFVKEDKLTYSYRSNNVGTKHWVECTSYVTLRHKDGSPAMFTYGFSLIDILGASRQEHQMQAKENFDIIKALVSEYSSVYYLDLDSGVVTPYIIDEQSKSGMSEIFETSNRFDIVLSAYIDRFVYGPDREMMKLESSREYFLKMLEDKESNSVNFRGVYSDEVTFCEMKYGVARRENGEVKSIVLGFAHKDKEIMAQYINEKLVAEYISAFMVDLDNDKYRIYRHPDTTNTMDREDKTWSLAMTDFAKECDPEYFELVKNIGTPEFLRKELKDVDRREYLYRFQSAKQPWRRAVVQVIDRDNGVPSNVVATFMGIDDYQSKINDQQKQLETQQKQLAEALVMAQTANEAKTTFLNSMSHDIRTPLNAITGFTDIAKRYVGNEEKVLDYLDKIETSGQQLLELVNQVLEMSRIEAGKTEINAIPVNIHEEYTSMVTVLAEQARENGLDFCSSYIDIRHNNVLADRARMSSITLNIAGNAMKYTPEGGRVDFTFKEIESRKPGYATFVLTVKDTGIGMSEEYLKKLYEPFTRENSTTVSKIQGTGLGMSIVKELIDLLGGKIDVESELGKGTKFDVTVDFKINEKVPSASGKAKTNSKETLKGCRVLLVEDNVLNREIAVELLSEEGLIVEEAEDGLASVETLKRNGPDYYDFILMDIQMPVMNGYEATKAIRAMYPDSKLPIIALSANAFAEDKAASIAAGMDDHVAKPINIKELLKILANYLK